MFRPQKTRLKLYNTLAVPAGLYCTENWTVKARDARRVTAAEMKCMRKQQDTLVQFIKELNKIPVLDKIQEYRTNCLQHINKMSCNWIPKNYRPTGKRNRRRPLKILLDVWDQNRSTSGPTLY